MEFYIGGYFIVRGYSSDKSSCIPNNYFSASNCISDVLPDTWAWNETISKNERKYIRDTFDLTDDQIECIRTHTAQLLKEKNILYPYVFQRLDIAREFYNTHFSQIKNVKIISIFTNKEFADEFLLEEGGNGFGVSINLSSLSPTEPKGKYLGYELLGYEYWSFHTMYCHRELVEFCKNDLHIRFNEHGLIDELDDATKAVNCIIEGKIGAEPALWQPWRIYEYEVSE